MLIFNVANLVEIIENQNSGERGRYVIVYIEYHLKFTFYVHLRQGIYPLYAFVFNRL